VLLVHRPRHSDWSFPKGKREEGETDEDCALREVWEETRLRCRLGPVLGSTNYRVEHRRPKTVVYYRMEPEGEPAPGDGVDRVRWATPDEALALLTWPRDRDLLTSVVDRL
jgi:8-oxo-dGTP diphosphatase